MECTVAADTLKIMVSECTAVDLGLVIHQCTLGTYKRTNLLFELFINTFINSFRPGIVQAEPTNSNSETQPPMMTLKQFLATQDDSISDNDAIQKYNEYKLEFKRQQLNEFFVAHKDEEW
jgi:hypothetical protein